MTIAISESGASSSLGKRQRADEDDESTAFQSSVQSHQWKNFPFVRHEQLWFEDGTVVVRALGAPATPEGAPTVHGFKCHQSVLARRSSRLHDMFTMLPDDKDQQKVDGVPCVDLWEKFEDVRDLLLMMYGLLSWREWMFEEGQEPMLLENLLKIAAKYGVVKVYDRLVDRLEALLPRSYRGWRHAEEGKRESVIRHRNIIKHQEVYGPLKQKFTDPMKGWCEPARALVLVEELGLKDLLRTTWYNVARYHASGPTPFKAPEPDTQNQEAEPQSRVAVKLDLLSGPQVRRLLVGRERLVDALEPRMRSLHLELEGYREEPPEPHAECLASVRQWWEEAMCGKRFVDLVRDPLGEFVRLQSCLRDEAALREYHGDCSGGCSYGWFQAKLHSASIEMWDLLPEMFGFEV